MVDAEAIKERVLGSNDEKSIKEIVSEKFSDVRSKSRIYVDSEEDVPDEYTPQTSDRGAVFYETDSGGSESSSPDDDLDEGDEILSGDYDQVIEEELESGSVSVDDLTEATGLPEDRIFGLVTGEYRPDSETREQLNEVLDGSVSTEYDGE